MELTFIKPFMFYFFASLTTGSALMVVIIRNPLYSAAMLVLTFFSLAGIYVLLNSEIIAVLQVFVYAGAIMVLVTFVIMLLNLRSGALINKPTHIIRSVVAVIFSFLLFICLISIFVSGNQVENAPKGVITAAAIESEGSFQLFSRALFSEYLLPFELVSLLLTVAVIGVVVLIRGISGAEENKQAKKGQGR
ncbi:MAG: NADH-quinone oxidoreductase subunit J [Spirochaetia bacterium]|nr:NADH-quinone oxidoreductase subunit J [Spirochaetia bacterium]